MTKTVLWQQPTLAGIAGNLNVRKPHPVGQFGLVLWQPNPSTPNGDLVPSTWSAGDKTGFYPTGAGELSFKDATGSSTAQAQGDTVGAYINSADIKASTEFKMMVSPEVALAPVKPFDTERALVVSLKLQIPTATDAQQPGSNAYASSDLLLMDPHGFSLSYSGKLFSHGGNPNHIAASLGIDAPTGNTMVNTPLRPAMPYLSLGNTSSTWQTAPWLGFKSFEYRISKAQFAAALAAIHQQYPQAKLSMNPADYTLTKWHLNAELHYQTAPASLGWSMKDAMIEVVS